MCFHTGPWLRFLQREKVCWRPDEDTLRPFMARLLQKKQIKVQSNLREKALPTTSLRSLGEVSSVCLQPSPA